jgi:hypothetical protein
MYTHVLTYTVCTSTWRKQYKAGGGAFFHGCHVLLETTSVPIQYGWTTFSLQVEHHCFRCKNDLGGKVEAPTGPALYF